MILDVDFDSYNDLVRLVTVCCCKFGQNPCMTCMAVRNTSNTQCNMTYVPACTTQLYMCEGTRYPICGYQSSNGMLQDSKFQVLMKLKDWVTNVEKLFTQSEIEG